VSHPNEDAAARRPVVLLTGSMDPAALQRLAAAAEVRQAADTRPETLRAAVREAEVLVVRTMLPADIFGHAPRLRGVVRQGVGLDMIPMDAANARGLPVANVPGSNRHAVAEHVLSCLGELRRRVARMDAQLRAEGWAASRAHAEQGRELHGSTIGIVGLGNVGTRLAEICHHGYGMVVLGNQRRRDQLPAFVHGVGLDELLARSDAVVLCCPLTPQTQGLIDARRLALMKHDALLVNVARGAVVDEVALVAALQAGRLGGAALDVFSTQPLAPKHPLLALDRVLLTPHAAGLTVESMRRMSEGAVDEALRLLAGQWPQALVNPQHARLQGG
jgi:D-3-phosphoglycerate dehydrogenase / 2-oxoglutarate reductase